MCHLWEYLYPNSFFISVFFAAVVGEKLKLKLIVNLRSSLPDSLLLLLLVVRLCDSCKNRILSLILSISREK